MTGELMETRKNSLPLKFLNRWGYEKPEERWLPVHTVETILLSVISMLADPNFESPANVDAAVCFLFYHKEIIFGGLSQWFLKLKL